MADSEPAAESKSSLATDEPTGSVKRKAAAGALLVGGRTFAVRILGLVGNLVLARLLTPEDFGIVAAGNIVVMLGTTVFDGGLGASLVRGSVKPTASHYGTLLVTQLALSLSIVLAVGLFAAARDFQGPVILAALLMSLSMPMQALRAPHVVHLERDLRYGPLVRVEIAEAIIFNVWAVGTVALGAGVWGFASAIVVRTACGAVLLSATSGLGWVKLRFSWLRLREMFRFGATYQAMGVAGVGRDQMLNTLIVTTGGLAMLGLWSFAFKLIQPFSGIFETLRHVSYPGMARLRDAGEDTAAVASLALRITCVATALVVVPAAATANISIALVFGEQWAPAADAFALSLVSLLILGPVSAACAGFLLSEGRAGIVLRMVLIYAAISLGAYALLSPVLGLAAVGAGAIIGSVVNAFIYNRSLKRLGVGIGVLRNMVRPLGCAAVAGAVGYGACASMAPDWVTLGLGIAASLAVVLALDAVFCREAVNELRGVAGKLRSG